tara:strand:+ start:182 stop:1063 length:882 start_codon:yes stop_codon:yes gene_type:complete
MTTEPIIKHLSPAVTTVSYKGCIAGFRAWTLLSSDRHHDAVQSRHGLEKQHLDEAKQRDALIIDYGDLFDLMQGRNDRRSSHDNLRKELVGENYLNNCVNYCYDFYKPYADNWLILGQGNHETAYQKHNSVNPTQSLWEKMVIHNPNIKLGGYSGWVKFNFCRGERSNRQSFDLFYHHGYGHGGYANKGVSSGHKVMATHQCDIFCQGHSHDSFIVPRTRMELTKMGRVRRKDCYTVRTPGYKDAYNLDGKNPVIDGFEVEKGFDPKPLGAIWLEWYYSSEENKVKVCPHLAI